MEMKESEKKNNKN